LLISRRDQQAASTVPKRQTDFKLHTYVPSSVTIRGAPNWHWCWFGVPHGGSGATTGLVQIRGFETKVQFQHGAASSSTGCPVPARDMSQSHFWSQFQHGAPRCGTVPQRGCRRPSSSTGRKCGPSSSTGPVHFWGPTYTRQKYATKN
jgi:hypothetical protein